MSDSKVYMVPDGASNNLDPNLMFALSQNGGFGNNGSWMWMMFMWILFPWLFNGNNGFGGNNGFLSNQLNNTAGRDLLLQAINGRADALTELANILNTSLSTVQNGVYAIQSAVQTVGSQVGLSGAQVINSVQQGNAQLSQQLCKCCCDNQLAVVNQTNALQSQAAANHADAQLQRAQIESADQLAVCQQTNQLGSQADRNTNNILNAISAQNTLITKEFCDLKERELQNKIDTQGDIITQLRGQISNDKQTEAFNSAINALNEKINQIAYKQPNTIPVQWPNIIAANATPYVGNWQQTSFWN